MTHGSVNGAHPNGRLRKNLMAGHMEGAAFGGMVGLGETYLPAFVLALGLGEIMAGLVASVPLLAGGLMQTISPMAVHRLASYKRWVLICAFVQACSFVPLIVAAARGTVSAAGILLVAAVYWASGLATGPAWNTWMGGLVPRSVRTRFFAHRTRASQLAVLVGLVVGGCLLQVADGRGAAQLAFLALFAAASACRVLSLALLATQHEPPALRANMERMSARKILLRMRDTSIRRLLLYLVMVQGAVQLSGPFFTPFMFEKLRLSYVEYVALIATAFLAKIVALPTLGSVAHRLGALRLLWLGGIGIVPLPAMWILSGHFGWLLCVQAFSGVCWGAYELGFFLLFFDSIPDNERTGVLTLYNLGNTVTWVLGSAVGGLLLCGLGTDRFGYCLLFGISAIGRFLALPLLKGVSSAVSAPCTIAVRTVGVRPMDVSVDAPVLPSLPDQLSEALPANVPLNEIGHPRTAGNLEVVELGQRGPDTPGASHRRHRAQHAPASDLATTPTLNLPSVRNPCVLDDSKEARKASPQVASVDVGAWEETHAG